MLDGVFIGAAFVRASNLVLTKAPWSTPLIKADAQMRGNKTSFERLYKKPCIDQGRMEPGIHGHRLGKIYAGVW